MDFPEQYVTLLYWAFGLAFLLGVIANKTNFCTMGAVSDWVNMGDKSRMRSWMLAIFVALVGVMTLEWLELVDMSLTASNDTSNPPYRTPTFDWLRYITGGLIFGVGMTIGSGCGNKSLIRLGGGNLKSIFVLLMIAIGSYLMIFTNFGYNAFLQWMAPFQVDFGAMGIESQAAGAVVAGLTGAAEAEQMHFIVGGVLAFLMFVWIVKSREFITNFELLFAGLAVGGIILVAWYFTAGELGQTLLEELEFADARPYAVGAQSFTFIAPAAHAAQLTLSGFDTSFITFGLIAAAGVICGSFLYSILFRAFRFEWFTGVKDFLAHTVGGLLMGIGGVLAMGCTVGQAISGASTLALGSFLTFAAIVFSSALTMKYQYYRMVYEGESSILDALLTAMVELRVLPSFLRRLDAI